MIRQPAAADPQQDLGPAGRRRPGRSVRFLPVSSSDAVSSSNWACSWARRSCLSNTHDENTHHRVRSIRPRLWLAGWNAHHASQDGPGESIVETGGQGRRRFGGGRGGGLEGQIGSQAGANGACKAR